MSKPLIDIMNLNLTRYGKEFNIDKFKATLNEELDEMFTALEDGDIEEFLDGANDAIVVLAGGITQHGYNPQLTLKQVVKEITSREQDPEQQKRWTEKAFLQDKEKWLKDKGQDPKSLYKANFNLCKIGR